MSSGSQARPGCLDQHVRAFGGFCEVPDSSGGAQVTYVSSGSQAHPGSRSARERLGDSMTIGQPMSANIHLHMLVHISVMSRKPTCLASASHTRSDWRFEPRAAGVFAVGFDYDRFAELPQVCSFIRGHITPVGSLRH